IALKLFEIVCARLRQTTQQAESLMFLHLPGRLANALLQRSALVGGACEPKIGITQKDLGNLVGASRESTNRQLRLWEQQGWVRMEGVGFLFCQKKPLKRFKKSFSKNI